MDVLEMYPNTDVYQLLDVNKLVDYGKYSLAYINRDVIDWPTDENGSRIYCFQFYCKNVGSKYKPVYVVAVNPDTANELKILKKIYSDAKSGASMNIPDSLECGL